MFKSISIENYRGIRKASIPNLSKINLFYGKNNSGKSSLLEAVFLLTGQSNPLLPVQTNASRGISELSLRTICYDFYKTNPDNSILISADGDTTRNLQIQLIKSDSHTVSLDDLPLGKSDSNEGFFGIKMFFGASKDRKHSSELIVSEKSVNKGKVKVDSQYKETLLGRYIPPAYFMQFDEITEHLTDIIKDKKEQEIVVVLRVIDQRVKDIQVVGKDIMVDVGLSERLPISVLGDGIRKLLSIIVSIHLCKNGICIIDELDNGMHFSVMTDVWRAILIAAKEYNVQLFVSSHSLDTIKSLVSAANDDADCQSMVSTYKLFRKEDDEIVALHYDYRNLAYAVEHEMEVR